MEHRCSQTQFKTWVVWCWDAECSPLRRAWWCRLLPSQEDVLCLCNGSIAAKSMLWNGIFTFLTFSVKAKIFFGFLCVNKWKSFSRVRLFAAPWAVESMEFCRPEYWSGEHFSSPGDLPNPRIKPSSPTLQADSSPAEPQGEPKNTEVGSLFFLQQIFLTQETNWGLLHCRQILYQLSHKGSPRILKWVAYPFSRRSSPPRNGASVCRISGGFFTNWAIKEAPFGIKILLLNINYYVFCAYLHYHIDM